MIIVFTKTFSHGLQVDRVVNRSGIEDAWWLILAGSGFDPARFLVKAYSEADAIDYLTDSRWGFHLKDGAEPCDACQAYEANGRWLVSAECACSFAGNSGERIDEDRITLIEECQRVNFFSPKNYQCDS